MTTIIQVIETQWTKRSRSAPRATLRNSVPENYLLGLYELDDDVYTQRISYAEINEFSEPYITDLKRINENQQREMKLELKEIGDRLDVFCSGIPLRDDYPKAKKIGVLSNNTWLKIVGNVRTSWESTWAYYKYVYNVFYGDSSLFDSVVLDKKSEAIFVDEAKLW